MTAIVAVLAGGAGRRIGGDKAGVLLAGRPLISYPLEAATRAQLETVVVAKAATTLPALRTAVMIEPAHLPQHPLSGIVTVLRSFPALVAVPCDMPFVTAGLLRALADADGELVTAASGLPFPGRYTAALLDPLDAALKAEASLRSVLNEANASVLAGIDPALLFSVNSPEYLAEAERAVVRAL